MTEANAPPTRLERLEALVLACLLAVLFLGSALLPGRSLMPHPPELFDVPMAEAIAAGRFDPADAYRGNLGMADKYLQSLCWDRVMQDRFAAGELPRWTRDIGGGAPFVPQMAQPYQPINLLLFVLPAEQWYGWWWFVHQVLFAFFAYTFLRRVGIAHAAALLGLVAAALGTWTQGKVHHNVILTAALSLWPMLSAVHALVVDGVRAGPRRVAIAWLALWAGLSWSSGFVVVSLQTTYLTLGFAAVSLWTAPRGDRLRRLVPVGFGFALGGLWSLANMLPVLLASAESARSGVFDAAKLGALGLEWDHLLTLVWPDLLAPAQNHFYVGETAGVFATAMPWSQLVLLANPLRPDDGSAFQNWTETTFAVGLAPLACAALALGSRRHRWLAVAAASVLVLAFGIATADEPFLSLAHLAPGLTAADLRRLLFTVFVLLVVLTGIGGDELLRRCGARATAGFWTPLSLVIAASLGVLWWLWQNADADAFVRAVARLYVADHDHPHVQMFGGDLEIAVAQTKAAAQPGEALHNHAQLTTTALRALLVGGLALLTLALAPRRRLLALALLTTVELWHVGRGPVQTVPAERVTTLPRVVAELPRATEANGVRPRLVRLVGDAPAPGVWWRGNLPAFLGLEDAGAYNPLPKARYEQFMAAIDPRSPYRGAGVGPLHDPAALHHPLCDLYGIRYVVTREPVPADERLRDRTPDGTGGFRLLERTTALPRATFVREVDVLPDPAARLRALAAPDRDVRGRIVLEHESAPRPTPVLGDAAPPAAEVTIERHDDELVVVRVRTALDGYLRLADPFDAGWRATVDGEEQPILIADHYLRGVYLTPGEHEVVFTYDGARVVWPVRLAALAWLAVGWLLLTGLRRTR